MPTSADSLYTIYVNALTQFHSSGNEMMAELVSKIEKYLSPEERERGRKHVLAIFDVDDTTPNQERGTDE